jgi:hypothetical protein
MNKICTTIEQSKKLIKLGVDVNIADMTYVSMKDYDENTYHLTVGKTDVNWAKDELGNLNWNDVYEKYIPAWSLTALMNLLPSEFTIENKFGKYTYEIKIRKYNLIEDVNLYQIAYGNYKIYEDGSSSWKDMINTGEREELLDAVFDMIVWLKENGKI